MFQEFTASNDSDEVMFDVDETGKIIDLYTYRDHGLEYYSEPRDDFFPLATDWKPQQNELFVHCPPRRVAFCAKKLLSVDNGFVFCGDDDTEPLFKMAVKYNLPTEFIH